MQAAVERETGLEKEALVTLDNYNGVSMTTVGRSAP